MARKHGETPQRRTSLVPMDGATLRFQYTSACASPMGRKALAAAPSQRWYASTSAVDGASAIWAFAAATRVGLVQTVRSDAQAHQSLQGPVRKPGRP